MDSTLQLPSPERRKIWPSPVPYSVHPARIKTIQPGVAAAWQSAAIFMK
jgi:hypothetical protein